MNVQQIIAEGMLVDGWGYMSTDEQARVLFEHLQTNGALAESRLAPSEDVEGVVERLKSVAAKLAPMAGTTLLPDGAEVLVAEIIAPLYEAAALLTTLSAERDEAREALRPFAEAVAYEAKLHHPGGTHTMVPLGPEDRVYHSFTQAQVRHAAAILNKETRDGE